MPDSTVALDHAVAAGVSRFVTMGIDAGTSSWAVAAAQEHEPLYAAVGMHPTSPGSFDPSVLEALLTRPKVVAVGEVGIDLGPHCAIPLDQQLQRLHAQCELALAHDMPICVHIRDSASELEGALSQHSNLRGVIHYFSLDVEWANRFLSLGMHLSFSGLVTRTSRAGLREVVRLCPADRLLLETDAPFGIPRGRNAEHNQPAWLLDTAQVVADVRGTTMQELAELESANARLLFRGLN